MVFEIIAAFLMLAATIFFGGPACLTFIVASAQLITEGIKSKAQEWSALFVELREEKEGRRND